MNNKVLFGFFLSVFILFFLFSCAPGLDTSTGSGVTYVNDNNSRVVSTDISTYKTKSLTVLLSLKITDTTSDSYLVTKQIKNIGLKLNNKKISGVSSNIYDIDNVEKNIRNSFYIRREKTYYQIDIKLVDYSEIDTTTDLTTGKISKILNGGLSYGGYFLEIENLEITSSIDTNITKKISPFFIKQFTIKDFSDSFFVGEIELTIKI